MTTSNSMSVKAPVVRKGLFMDKQDTVPKMAGQQCWKIGWELDDRLSIVPRVSRVKLPVSRTPLGFGIRTGAANGAPAFGLRR